MGIWHDMIGSDTPDIFWSDYDDPEVFAMLESGTAVLRTFDRAECQANLNSYFHDLVAKRMYIHTSDNLTPRNSKYNYVCFFNIGFTNVSSQEYPACYIPREGESDGSTITYEYYPFLSQDNDAAIDVSAGEMWQDVIRMNAGGLKFNNAPFWYRKKNDWIFYNRTVWIKVGEISDAYADFILVFTGKMEEPTYDDSGISISIQDIRYGILKSIPPDIFEETRYPDIEDSYRNNPIPILFGIKNDIKPPRVQGYDATNQWAWDGGCELWYDASNMYYWLSVIAGTSTVNRDGVNQRSGSYCARLDVDALNSNVAIRTRSTASYGMNLHGIWLNPDGIYRGRFYYYNSVAGKTARWQLLITINGVNYYWNNASLSWVTAVTNNNLANALAYTEVTFYFYLPEFAEIYVDEFSISPLFFRFARNSAASSSIYFDDFSIIKLPTYKISQTKFNNDFSLVYDLQSIDNVYQAGVEIFSPASYVYFLEAGSFALLADPGNDEITCNAHGLKVQYDFTTGNLTDTFTENTADILYFILNVLNEILEADINLPDFLAFQAKRTQRIGWYLVKLEETINFIKLLQRSAIFRYIAGIDGKHTVKYYDRAVSATTPVLWNCDFVNYEFSKGTGVYYKVYLKFNKHPMADEYEVVSIVNELAAYAYNEKATLGGEGIIVALVDSAETNALAEFYLALIEKPPETIKAKLIDCRLFDVLPSDKIKVNRTVYDSNDEEIVLHDEEIYAIISKTINLRTLTTEIEAGADINIGGQAIYGDIPYLDHDDDSSTYYDSAHGDVIHANVAHVDTTPHDDEAEIYEHLNANVYTDHDDAPLPHEDKTQYYDHTDITPYEDHTDHNDTTHQDIPHTNVGHIDETVHQDIHQDVPHTDSWI